MENLKEMIDVNKVVGDAVETPDGQVIIPVSRLSFGFAAGGSEFESSAEELKRSTNTNINGLPFGGGSGGGVSLRPVAFLVAGQGEIRLMLIDRNAVIDRLIDTAPQLISYIHDFLTERRMAGRQEI
jgi:sporulation protein YtfJ